MGTFTPSLPSTQGLNALQLPYEEPAAWNTGNPTPGTAAGWPTPAMITQTGLCQYDVSSCSGNEQSKTALDQPIAEIREIELAHQRLARLMSVPDAWLNALTLER